MNQRRNFQAGNKGLQLKRDITFIKYDFSIIKEYVDKDDFNLQYPAIVHKMTNVLEQMEKLKWKTIHPPFDVKGFL